MRNDKQKGHNSSRFTKFGTFAASLVLSLCTVQSALAQVNLSQVPLFLKESVDSNLVFVFDDSGSMGWRYMPDSLGGSGSRNYYYSSHVNKVYYDPTVTYLPPFKPDGSGRFPDSSYTNAWVDGFNPSGARDNLSNNIRFDSLGAIEEGFYMQFNSSPSCDSNPMQDSCYTPVLLNTASADIKQNYANWFSYYSTRALAAKSGITEAFFDLPETIRIGYGAINVNNNTIDGVNNTDTLVSGVRTYDAARRQQFLTWLQGKNVSGGTPLRTALKDVGEYYSRADNRGPWGETPGTNDNTDHIECRQSFAILMTDGIWNGSNPGVGNTDNTAGPSYINPDPDGADFTYSPVSPFSDSHSNTLADVAMEYWKNDLRTDLDNKVPLTSTDPAFWQHMTTFTIGMGVVGDVSEADALAALDPASGITITWPNPTNGTAKIDDLLHAAINARGGYASAQNPSEFTAKIQGFLGDVIARSQTSASAAAVSSAVLETESLGFFAGFRSDDWSGTLTGYSFSLGSEIWDVEEVLANTPPANRKLITHTGSQAVELKFNSAGDLSNLSTAQQNALNADPTLSASQDNLGHNRLAWLHGDNTAHPTFRNRLVKDSGGADVLRLLGDIINANPQLAGKTNYGFSTLDGTEGTSYPTFRADSSYQNRIDALYVPANDGILHAFNSETGEELFGYIPSELLLPSGSNTYARISELMSPTYTHKYFMDGTPRIQDAYIDKDGDGTKEWRTILLGAMGAGGKTIFALDVTDPGSFSPADDVLWEFKHPNLGYGVSNPNISRLESGQWVALFGNGYNGNSNESSLFVVDLATGSLIKELNTGAGSTATPNGLAEVGTASFPESDAITRYAYAGDLLGNLWRFSLTGAASGWGTTKLFNAKSPAGYTQPITVAPRLAINPDARDELVIAFGTGSFMRSGDEGDYDIQSLYAIYDNLSVSELNRSDLLEQTITQQKSVVVDKASGSGTNSFTVRDTSNNELTDEKGWYLDLVYNSNQVGERVVSQASFPFGIDPDRIRFTTMIPDSDPCGSGLTGFIMDLKLTSGAPSESPVFDLNSDGIFDTGDLISDFVGGGTGTGTGTGTGNGTGNGTGTGTTDGGAPSGIQVGYGGEIRTIATTDGETEILIPGLDPTQLSPEDPFGTNPSGSSPLGLLSGGNLGRQTWEQVR
ncbi:pilus assembly protein [Marinobacter sp. ANT_B65]|uniref:pilus assembly protein n=1 Tax=Marinobacter sp. ANT_B65 TaxID=2039467 RepID=UPI0015C977C4|nr:PilC/PilY family type IV pilus protein [Marinobacter sp. ANT_B65]